MAEPGSSSAAELQGLIAACDRALLWLLDPDLPGGVDRGLVAHVVQVRGRAADDLTALAEPI